MSLIEKALRTNKYVQKQIFQNSGYRVIEQCEYLWKQKIEIDSEIRHTLWRITIDYYKNLVSQHSSSKSTLADLDNEQSRNFFKGMFF